MTALPPSLEAVMRKVRAQAGKRRIALQPFFADFDHLHSGRITAAQFARVLNSNDMQLTEDELGVLINAFALGEHGSSGAAAAAAGSLDVTAASSAELQANPSVLYNDFLRALQAAPGTMAAVRLSTVSAALTDAEEARLAPVRRMLQQAIKAHGTSLIAPFRDLDPLRTGRVTATQFRRCLPFPSTLSEDAMALFAKQYSDGRGGVYYMPWCRAMDPSLNEKDEEGSGYVAGGAAGDEGPTENATSLARASFFQSTTSGLARDAFANAALSAPELIAIFRQQCALYRTRYEDALHDMDKMKTGRVTAAQFESALGRMPLVHFALRSENVETLARHYANGYVGPLSGCMVDYRSFLRDIHPSQATQTAPDGTCTSINFFATAHAADTFLTSDADQEAAAALLERLRANIRANRISLSPVLRDFDRVRKGIYEHRTCTHPRFARGLATQNILLPPEELQLLIRKYTVPNPDGSPSSEVNYYLFVQDVDPSQVNGGLSATRSATAHTTLSGRVNVNGTQTMTTPAVTKEDAVQRVARQVVARRLHLSSFLDAADPMHSGAVSKAKFGPALGQAGVELREGELTALETAFASPRVPAAVDTAAFLSEVQAAVSVAQQQQAVPSGADRGSVARLDSASPELLQLLHRVQHNVRVHNALLLPFFADFDRNHRGVITPAQFAQACVRHHLPLAEAELRLLADAYKTDAAHTDEVHYLNFIRDVGCAEESPAQAAQHHVNAAALARSAAVAAAAAAAGAAGSSSSPSADADPALANTVSLRGTTAAAGTAEVAAADVDDLLTKICLFLQERRPRLGEFFPDGDELRHHHVTPSRFRHCLSMLGLTSLTEAELRTLEGGFASVKCPGEVDYTAFVCTLRAMLAEGAGVAAVTQRRLRGSTAGLGSALGTTKNLDSNDNTINHNGTMAAGTASTVASDGASTSTAAGAFAATTLRKVRRMLLARRTATIAAFREYDRARKGFVTDGQFFACLQALGVSLRPDEASALLQLYGVGGGQVHYLAFAQEVDDAALVAVS